MVEDNNAWTQSVKIWIKNNFPNLTSSEYKITSPDTVAYNCVAWAAEDDKQWWWSDAQNEEYWPPNVLRKPTLEAFVQAFQTLGYEVCQADNLEDGFQKIAIYIGSDEKPKHVARQLPNGKWTSKLGQYEDIEHDTLQGIAGEPGYGTVTCIMKKPLK